MIGALLVLALLILLFLSPVAAYRAAAVLERIAAEFRHHGGAMAGGYAAYRGIRRGLAAGARFQAAAAREGRVV